MTDVIVQYGEFLSGYGKGYQVTISVDDNKVSDEVVRVIGDITRYHTRHDVDNVTKLIQADTPMEASRLPWWGKQVWIRLTRLGYDCMVDIGNGKVITCIE